MRFVIVTGMSGAGKTTALHYLEDADYYCVDNLPIPLIRPFAQIAADGNASEFTKFAVGIDIRSAFRDGGLGDTLSQLREAGIKYEILFLDASDDVLLMRYKETRRTHPLAGKTGGVESAIASEREKLSVLKEKADFIIDTSKLLTRELKSELVRIFIEDLHYKNLYITVQSFGFKYGIPADSDLVVDVRFLPNPYYVEELRPLTGEDPEIVRFVTGQDACAEFVKRYTELLQFLIPRYVAEGKNQLVISVGCTGGRHRSVAITNEIASILKRDGEYGVRVEHRDIAKDPVRKQQIERE